MKKYSVKTFHLKVFVLAILLVSVCAALVLSFSLINSEPRANEKSAFQIIHTIRECQNRYAQKHMGNFAPDFDELVKPGCLDDIFRDQKPVINRYVFEIKFFEATKEKPEFYSITADPQIPEGFYKTGSLHFYYDSTLRAVHATDENRQATPSDPSI